jgi:hypothetical protein
MPWSGFGRTGMCGDDFVPIVALTLCLGLLSLGCASETPGVAQREEVYQRATVQFNVVDLFKPTGESDELTFRLAPLIMQETRAARHGAEAKGANGLAGIRDSGLEALSNRVFTLEAVDPTLYVVANAAKVQGHSHPQFTYLWFYPAKRAVGQGRFETQGIRLTLNSAGEPVIWEVLAEPSGAQLVFVAQSLEAAAQAEFGKPLPNRRFAIERSLTEAPETMVARVIDDGPVPMGPIVYLARDTHAVSTLICRCMPAQAKRLAGSRNYRLVGITRAEALGLPNLANASVLRAFLSGDQSQSDRLERRLRLPGTL